jgi:hypothetical protein
VSGLSLVCFSCNEASYCSITCAIRSGEYMVPYSDITTSITSKHVDRPYGIYYYWHPEKQMSVTILCKKCAQTRCKTCGGIKGTNNCACPK